jgi:DNA-binding Lrp family transcriptional regulator
MEPLFEEWMRSMEKSILLVLREKGPSSPEEIASGLGISEKNAITFLTRMAEKGTIKITGVKAAS